MNMMYGLHAHSKKKLNSEESFQTPIRGSDRSESRATFIWLRDGITEIRNMDDTLLRRAEGRAD